VITLYDHLTDVIDQLVMHYPDQALLKFEEVSYLLKNRDTIKIEEFIKTQVTQLYSLPDSQGSEAT